MTRLSIITINYNNRAGLERTMLSVIAQRYEHFEYIVIDGGSTDGSDKLIKDNEQHLRYWISERDNGIYHAMNKGIVQATGEYILFLNSGDHLLDHNVIGNVFKEPQNAAVLYGDLQLKNRAIIYPDKLNFTFFFRDSIGHPAAFIRRNLFDQFGLYNEHNHIVSDWEFFLRVIVKEKQSYRHIKSFITFYDDSGISMKPENATVQVQERSKVLKDYIQDHYQDLLDSFTSMQMELNQFKNSRAVKMVNRLTKSKLYRKLIR